MEIKTFQDHHLDQLRKELNTAILGVLAKYGVNHQLGTMRYNPSECRVKLTLRTKQSNTLASAALSAFASADITATIANEETQPSKPIISGFHNEFMFKGTNYTVVKYKERNHRYPVLARRKYGHTGPNYKFPLEALNPIIPAKA